MGNSNEVIDFQILINDKNATAAIEKIAEKVSKLNQYIENSNEYTNELIIAIESLAATTGRTFKSIMTGMQNAGKLTDEQTNRIILQRLELEKLRKLEAARTARVGKAGAVIEDLQKPDPLNDIIGNANRIKAENTATQELNASLALEEELKVAIATSEAKANNAKRLLDLKAEAAAAREATQALREKIELEKLNSQYSGGWSSGNVGAHLPDAPNPTQRLGMSIADIKEMPKSLESMMAQLKAIKSLNPSTTWTELGSAMRKAGADSELVAGAMKKLNPNIEEVTFSLKRAVEGFLVAAAISAAMQIISKFFSDAVKAGQDARKQFAQLNFSEAILSKKGMDITRAELDGFVKTVGDKYKYLSSLEVTGIVATVADMGAEFDISKEKILGLSDAVAFIQLSERAYGQEVSDTGSVVNAMLDGRSNFFNKLGINITKTAIKEKAYAMGLAKSGQALTKEMSNQAAIALLIEQTSGKYDDLIASIEKTNPALAKQMQAQKATAEMYKEIGIQIVAVTDGWNNFILSMKGGGDEVSQVGKILKWLLVIILSVGLYAWKLLMNIATIIAVPFAIMASSLDSIIKIFKAMISGDMDGAGKALVNYFGKMGKDVSDAWAKGMAMGGDRNSLLEAAWADPTNIPTDTPTQTDAVKANMAEGQDEDTAVSVEKAFADLKKNIEDENRKLEQDKFEASIDLQIKLDDVDINYAQKVEDIITNYNHKIEDINRDYGQKVIDINNESNKAQTDAQTKFNQENLNAEQEYQNKLLKMREDYLMDLEDALHERDAKQVIKLMKKYALDKTQAARDHALDKTQRAQAFQAEMAQIKNERAQKLAEAASEHAQKLEEANIAKQRELDDANLWREREQEAAQRDYQRKLEDLHRHYQQRLQELGRAMQAELQLTAQQTQALQQMLLGQVDAYDQHVAALLAKSAAAQAQITAGATGSPTTSSTIAGGGSKQAGSGAWSLGSAISNAFGMFTGTGGVSFSGGGTGGTSSGSALYKMAEGGSIIANRPTSVMFGEKGAEMASFMPLGRTGKDINRVFGGGGASSGGGDITIALDLSPDLEARIMSNTLNETARIVTSVRRSK